MLPWLIVLIPFVFYKANRLNILALNEPVAIGVGIEIEKERRYLLVAAVAFAAAAVSVTGGISFIGLMAPHIAKSLVEPKTSNFFMPIALWFRLMVATVVSRAAVIGRNIVESIIASQCRYCRCFNWCSLLYVFCCLRRHRNTLKSEILRVFLHLLLPIPFKLLRQIRHLIFWQ